MSCRVADEQVPTQNSNVQLYRQSCGGNMLHEDGAEVQQAAAGLERLKGRVGSRKRSDVPR